MIELDDLTLREYFEIEDKTEWDFVLKYIEARDVFKAGDFTELSFGLIKEIQEAINNGMIWDKLINFIARILKKKERVIGTYKLLDIGRFKSYMISEIERINAIEEQLLGHTPTAEEKQAGIEEFKKFGFYGQIRTLAKHDVTKIDEVENMVYSIGLTELAYQKTESDFKKAYHDILYPKK